MNKKTICYLIITSLTYGYYLVLTKQGLTYGLDPLSFSMTTGLLAGLFSLVLLLPKSEIIKELNRTDFRDLIILGVLASGLSQLTIYYGQKTTSAINAGFLVKLTSLTTIPFAYFLVKERFKKNILVPIIVTLLGTFLLTTGGKLAMPRLGDLLIIFATIQLGFTNAYSKRVMSKISSYITSGFRLIFGGIFLFLIVFSLMGASAFTSFSKGFWFVLFSAILITIVIFTFYKGIELATPSSVAIFFLLSAVFSTLFAHLILGEAISTVQIIGGGLVLLGLYFLSR